MDLTINYNGITFVDAQAMRLVYPETFVAPNKEELEKIRKDDIVKVCVNDERFWVYVIEVNSNIVKGRIDNDLLQKELKYKDIIEFPKNCIFQINY